jgi:hypothetical protein
MMICPRCKKRHDILAYAPLRMIEEFLSETTPVYKCPSCRWYFAPAESLIFEVLKNGFEAPKAPMAEAMEVVAV